MERKAKFLSSLAGCALLLLAGCASTGTREGLVYRDGSWYSPAAAGHGDYYTGARAPEAWDHPWNLSVGIVPLGGYCPVRYRYCTSFWADPYFGSGYYGHYDPYWYEPWAWYYRRPAPHEHPHPLRPPRLVDARPQARDPEDRPRPRVWEERPGSGSGPAGRPPGSRARPTRRSGSGIGFGGGGN